jgi:hypothetical protein
MLTRKEPGWRRLRCHLHSMASCHYGFRRYQPVKSQRLRANSIMNQPAPSSSPLITIRSVLEQVHANDGAAMPARSSESLLSEAFQVRVEERPGWIDLIPHSPPIGPMPVVGGEVGSWH